MQQCCWRHNYGEQNFMHTPQTFTQIHLQNYIVRNVTSFTNYTVTVAITNDNGTGPISDGSSVRSCDEGEYSYTALYN